MKTFLYTVMALLAFAANSVLCRLALSDEAIDAASFTSVRLVSGVLMLVVILFCAQSRQKLESNGNRLAQKGSWHASLYLFVYAAAFSLAYVSLETGVGALVLFGAVQVTMIIAGLLKGSRLLTTEWLGVVLAFLGFVYLVWPNLGTPSALGFFLMTLSGVAWALYTLAGTHSKQALVDTTFNFVRTLPLVIVLILVCLEGAQLTLYGVMLAMLSGAFASGLGYAVWYLALAGLTGVQAGVVQLLVPVIAAVGGLVFAGEEVSLRLMVSSVVILGGIALVIWGRHTLKRSAND